MDTLLLLFAGDVLLHNRVQACARDSGYHYLFKEISPTVKRADLAICNLECPISPSGAPPRPFVFNGPPEALEGLKLAGFTGVSIVNNHSYDQGVEGFWETWREALLGGLLVVSSEPSIVKLGEVKLGLLAFTQSLNRGPAQGPARLLGPSALEAVRELESRVDLLIVIVHWGEEYRHEPTEFQRIWARRLVDAGADLVVGHHPHVLGPLCKVKNAWVAYSLGNLISNQSRKYTLASDPAYGDTRDGALLLVRLVGSRIDTAYLVPTWTENNWPQNPPVIRVVPTASLPDSLKLIRLRRFREATRCASR